MSLLTSKLLSRLMAVALVTLLAACGGGAPDGDEHGHADGAADDHDDVEEPSKGSHGGRLLEQGGYSVELALVEGGDAPRYQAWLYRGGKPLPATAGTVEVHLKRLGDVAEHHVLKPQADGSLLGANNVEEPHSFDVEVQSRMGGKSLQWAYPSYEGRTTITAAIATDSGIRVAPAGPGVIADEHEVQGLLTPIDGRVAKVMARFPGPIRSLRANVGDQVRAGQVLATIESNLSLTNYGITAPISGVVLSRTASIGALASEGAPLYEIADLSSLWVDIHIFGGDAQHIRPGVPVTVTRMSDNVTAQTTLERVLPGTATASQSTVARATINNLDGLWRPGSAVNVRITVEQQPTRLVVPLAALQNFRDWDAVFIRIGDTYEVRPLQLGKRDGRQVEVLSGLKAGDQVVVEQSYLVKADIEKSGASHDH